MSAVAPRTGSALGGTRVTIEGANFATGAMVAFGGTAATGVVVNSSTAISAMTPPGLPGLADLMVTVAGRSVTLSGAFTFTQSQSTNQPPILQ
ncbi:MAG TPA: IPT/TIG domain-containing protein, partial [Vicinamibacterales bacterium]|nr:IPT/TIG domain-containing protein [Vicinamibacterales bacterium]